MANASKTADLSGLARTLVQKGHLTEQEARQLQVAAAASGAPFASHLVASKRMKALELANFAARTFGLPLFDIRAIDPAHLPDEYIDARQIASGRVLPLYRRDNRLFVATADPTDLDALHDVKFRTGLTAEAIVVEVDKLDALIRQLAEAHDTTLQNLGGDDLDLTFAEASELAETEAKQSEIDDAPVVKYLQKILLDAINLEVSDIHIEPYEKFLRVRYRMDGVLYDIAQPPLGIRDRIATRIKVVSKLDISERRVPQDGRMKLVLSKNRTVDFRVSTLPTLFGEKIVLRILDPSSAQLGIDTLGYEPHQKALLLDAIRRPYGMVLVTGPTGSGKTVSLYTCLNILNQPDINISTAEDPAEINLPGVNQVNVNEKAGLTFATALRAFLRQDPDVIMVGEIRDLETADIAIKAAQTGHLVLSTLHTNDAPSTLARLLNMGVAPFNIAASVNLITAQRLIRRLCACKKPADLPREALARAGFSEAQLAADWTPYAPAGCDHCNGTGYKGRVGIYQVMPVSEAIVRIILNGGNAQQIADQARQDGVLDLRGAGLLKVMAGLTSLEEVLSASNL